MKELTIFMSRRIAKIYKIEKNIVHLEISKSIDRIPKDEPFLMTLNLIFFKDRPKVGDEFNYFMSKSM